MEGCPCNGLICLLAGGYEGDTLVCNPATGNTMVIQRGNKRKHTYVQGLGYCSSRNEFKVVRLCERLKLDKSIPENNHWYGCELFTVGQRGALGTNLLQHSRSWRYVGDLPYEIENPTSRIICYVNGSAHWMIGYGNSSSSEFILSLDLELEEFKVIARPEDWAEDESYDYMMPLTMHLMELEGKLCVVVNVFSRKVLEIWVLRTTITPFGVRIIKLIILRLLIDLYRRYFPVVAIWRGQLLLEVQA
ncbi:uncharacterized protein LOC122645229 [Telopea speciosissima]|uniref:uncharacterized protein LOC122645229 n=1 Tax=Telopea speciosissima TaxID=54955 RepID=UPI001CC51E50|nr:uncharacterized protein LOC122645229 [Telopea speciosissima]